MSGFSKLSEKSQVGVGEGATELCAASCRGQSTHGRRGPAHPRVHSECFTFVCKSTLRLCTDCAFLQRKALGASSSFPKFTASEVKYLLPVQSLPPCVSELHTLCQAHPVFIYIFLVFCSGCFFFFLFLP